jgi:ABC-type nickel/cobalt efflux system permease component RcnA
MTRLPWLLATLSLLMVGCLQSLEHQRDSAAAQDAARLRALVPPAEAEVAELRRQELLAANAAAQATASGDSRTAQASARLAAELGRIRSDAELRAAEQQAALDRRVAAAERQAAADREAERQTAARDADDASRRALIRWSALGLAASAACAVALLVLRLPPLIAVGLPAAVAAGSITLAAWLAVPWLAVALGCALGLGILALLAWLVRHLVHEWTDYADRLHIALPEAKMAADVASRCRQPRLIRSVLDRLVGVPS